MSSCRSLLAMSLCPRHADIKFLTANKDFTPKGLKDDTPYTVMFGADKCGDTNKVGAGYRRGWAFERPCAVLGQLEGWCLGWCCIPHRAWQAGERQALRHATLLTQHSPGSFVPNRCLPAAPPPPRRCT